jgi:high-affinity iron transporter
MRNVFGCCLACLACLPAARASEVAGKVRFPAGVDGRRSPAVVYLATKPAEGPSAGPTIFIDQRNHEFVPRVQVLPLGGSIVFRNSDRESHNVNSLSGCCSFNFMVSPVGDAGPGESEPYSPDKSGLIRLLCNIHQQMRGYVMVCPSPLCAVTDEFGNFRIEGVPDGDHKVIVWQESCKSFSQELSLVGAAKLDVELQASELAPRVAAPVRSGSGSGVKVVRPLAWVDVLRQIEGKLDAAVDAAQSSGSVRDADRLALDAYFECFEASELETAVLLFCGEERKFVLERMFAQIRRPLLADLAAGKIEARRVHDAIRELTNAIEEDIVVLHRHGVRDRTALGSKAPLLSKPAARVVAGPAEVSQVMSQLRVAFAEVERLAESGNGGVAAGALADSYFQIFHRIEPALASNNFLQMRQIEDGFLQLRGSIQAGMEPDRVRAGLDALWSEIDLASSALERANQGRFAAAANRFWNAFVILAREGVEALLIITALLLFLDRAKRPEAKRLIYGGIALALVATIFTWSLLQWAIARSGIAQETIEGVSALAAGALLFYVSYWLVSKSEGRRWQQFLSSQVDRNLTRGSRWAIGMAAFLAVYREGAETILMCQPMLVRPTAHELTGAIAGFVAAAVALAGIFWGLRSASFRMAIRPFFRVTGALLFTLAVVFAGKGVAELQEARVLAISPLPVGLHTFVMAIPSALRDVLGINANAQVIAIQLTIVIGASMSLASLWLFASPSPSPSPSPIAVQPAAPGASPRAPAQDAVVQSAR